MNKILFLFPIFLFSLDSRAEKEKRVYDVPTIIAKSANCDVEMGPTIIKGPKADVCSYILRCDYNRAITINRMVVANSDGSCPEKPHRAPKDTLATLGKSLNQDDLYQKKEVISNENLTCQFTMYPASTYVPLGNDNWDEYCSSPASCTDQTGTKKDLFLACPYEESKPYKAGTIFVCSTVSKCYEKRFRTEAPRASSTAGRRSSAPVEAASIGIAHAK